MKKLLLIPALALLLAACGGDDTGKKFADDVNTIQTQAANRINTSLATGDGRHIAATAADQFNNAANRIAALKAPKGADDERDALVDSLRAGSQEARLAAATGTSSDVARSLSATAAQVAAEIEDLNRSL